MTVIQEPAAGTTTALLAVRDLSVGVRRGRTLVPILDSVSFTVRAGEMVGLVGESGSGKTVSSLAAMGLLPRSLEVSGGSIEFEGRDLLRMERKQVRGLRGAELSMIFQDALRCLNPAFTIGDQIAEPLRVHRGMSRSQAHARAVELLELVEIPRARERARAYPHQLSGGMCQRVMIAIALACSPKLLIADEPTTALDVTVQKQVLRLLDRIQREMNLGVLFITHDLGVVAEICHRTAVMYAGQIVEEGPTEQLFRRPRHPYTHGLISSIPRSGEEARRFGSIPGTVPKAGHWPTGCHFSSRCPHAQAGRCDTAPVPLDVIEPAGPDSPVPHRVRCLRARELSLEGVA
ncbi:ABC transporter ATP-binding protein [Amycolatopsis thermophila]|uniref:Oligopeptide/dipeptide ABC transporter ATP-binding protein n=1 Tax=Amycolatopsis thermophila TaxID=206084 RepID=A0ABU0F681_9PSEU|nr:ABC transporter ATP-binding protein [Amycolatopsis thermophila]MDQ0382839.1 oligopeptide/dipeptide ABC transporter ATP-binding protein [Amycolatopsis thermophila]